MNERSVTETSQGPVAKTATIEAVRPNDTLAIIAEGVLEETFRDKQIGRFIATLIATTHSRRRDTDGSRSNALRRLSVLGSGNIGRPLTQFIARLQTNPVADHEPFVKLLLTSMTTASKP